jgi:hypothetical protein
MIAGPAKLASISPVGPPFLLIFRHFMGIYTALAKCRIPLSGANIACLQDT